MDNASDTSPDATRYLLEAERKRTPGERLRMVDELNSLTRHVAEAAIRCEHPDWSEFEIKSEMARRLLGPKLAHEVMAEIARREANG